MDDADLRPKHTPFSWALSAPALVVAMWLLLSLVVPGMRWGLPSETRNHLTLGDDRAAWRAPALAEGETENPWGAYPNFLIGGAERTGSQSRSAFNVIRSYHPDEYAILKSLSGMRPGEMKFHPGFFGWPAMQVYMVGAALKAASLFGAVRLVPDMDFYFQNPGEMAQLYYIGRWVTLLFALGCIAMTWWAGARLYGPAGAGAAALMLAVTPLFTINARYLTADVPMLFWIAAVLVASTYILRGGGLRAYVLAGIALGFAAGTRYQGALAAFLIIAAHVARPGAAPVRERLKGLLRSRPLWIAAGVSVAAFLLVNPYILRHPIQFAQEFAGEWHGSRSALSRFVATALFAEAGLGIIAVMVLAGALALLVARPNREGLVPALGFGLPALLLWLGSPAMARYFMPVLLFVPLLIAWAYAQFQSRAAQIGRRGARLAAPMMLALVLLLTFHQSWAWSGLYANPRADTRTQAGLWIRSNVPAGAVVGVVALDGKSEPWQFDSPPLDTQRYRIVILPPDPEALRLLAPDVVVSSDIQFPPLAIRHRLDTQEAVFVKEITEGRSPYGYVQRFEAWPFGHRAFLRHGPHDLRYVNPAISVALRSPSSSATGNNRQE